MDDNNLIRGLMELLNPGQATGRRIEEAEKGEQKNESPEYIYEPSSNPLMDPRNLPAPRQMGMVPPDLARALPELSQYASGANRGLADVAGAPVDAIARLLELSGVDPGKAPVGSSEWLKRLLAQMKATGAPRNTQDITRQNLGYGMGMGLGSAIPAARAMRTVDQAIEADKAALAAKRILGEKANQAKLERMLGKKAEAMFDGNVMPNANPITGRRGR